MKIVEQERDLFAAFGALPETKDEAPAAEAPRADLPPAGEIRGQSRKDAIRTFDLSYPITEPVADNDAGPLPPAPAEVLAPPVIKTGFSWSAFCGGVSALVWTGAALGGPVSYYGLDAVLAMDPALQAGLIALAIGPSLLFWMTGIAAGEAAKARRLANAMTKMAHETLAPLAAGETQAQRLSYAVQTEIEAMNDAVANAMTRLGAFEAAAKRHAAMFDEAVAATRENADYLASNLARERDALAELNGDLRGQTETMAHSIGRQVRLMREASKLVKSELGVAEDTLQQHVAAFAASAATMTERTSAIQGAAEAANAASIAANSAMAHVLDGLGQATHLTDAARQAAQQAALAANETASAVRETTQRAVVDAKRVAQLIRAETNALQDAAGETLARLTAAANAAREASEQSQAAADRHAAAIEKRLTALANVAAPRKAEPTAQERVAEVAAHARRAEERVRAQGASAEAGLFAAAATVRAARHAAMEEKQKQPRAQRNLFANPKPSPSPSNQDFAHHALSGKGGWSNMFPASAEERAPADFDAFDLVDFGEKPRDPDAELKSDVLDLIAAAGIDLADALVQSDLDRIAQRARQGAYARRGAVMDAAPGAVSRLLRHFKRSAEAKSIASAYRARPDLASSESQSEGLDLVRAYLLVDAALD